MNGLIPSRMLVAALRFYLRSAWHGVGRTVRMGGSRTWDVQLGPVEVAGSHLALRSPRLGDAAQWREVRLREQAHIEPWWITSPLSWTERHTDKQWVSYVLQARREARDGQALPLIVEVDGRLAGQCSLEPIATLAGTAEMGIWIDSAWARKGVALIAASLVIDHAMTELGVHRITAPICAGNVAAAWAARRLHFVREGAMAGFLDVGGARRDHHLWAITADRIPPGGLTAATLEAASRVLKRQQSAAIASPAGPPRMQGTPADANEASRGCTGISQRGGWRMKVSGSTRSEIRVVIQNGEYWLSNHGDLAMLQVTVQRLRERWPDARIGVLTSAPYLLRALGFGAEPISVGGRAGWPGTNLVDLLAEWIGPQVVGPASVSWLTARDLQRQYRRRLDQALRRNIGVGLPHRRVVRSAIPTALRDASLVLALGGGYVTDVDPEQARRTLSLLEHAVDRGIPTAMIGQGLGPLENPALLVRAERVLPRVDFIGLREGRRGPALLSRIGVPIERTAVTGDDAIELGYGARQERMGADVGVCLRVADYSPVARQSKDVVRRVVRRFAGEVGASLVPLIISEYRSEDRRSTLPLVRGFGNVVPPLGRYVTPRDVATRVSRCRVLVTGAYHLGVFALSQGIPVVGLASSRYYDDKFLGLRAMFQDGLCLIRLGEPDLEERLGAAVHAAWNQAPEVRLRLRERAVAQISTSRQGFERVCELVETSRRKASGRT
jgi:RimJ/RimL family protein N-acetyltransferase/polysaccharide pyruvyl transferase WcaK-like protein